MRGHENQPCRHMEGLLHRAADRKLRGFAKWYAFAHAARCPKCRQFLRSIELMVHSLRLVREEANDTAALARLEKVALESSPGQ